MEQQVIELKRSLIREIRKHPVIWDNAKKKQRDSVIGKAWNEITSTLKLPMGKTRQQWHFMRRHYKSILMNKTIERDTSFPTWAYFHDLTFLYENTKKVIKGKMGGISPLLFEPSADRKDPDGEACPCCLPASTRVETTSVQQPSAPQNVYEGPPPEEAVTQTFELKSSQSTSGYSVQDELNITPNLQNKRQEPPAVIQEPKRPRVKQTNQTQPSAKRITRRHVHLSNAQLLEERGKIIESIKAYPILYSKDISRWNVGVSVAWKRVAAEVGSPIHIIQTRWRLCKQRYAEELSRQQSSGGMYRSNWVNFDQMSFVKPHLRSGEGNIVRMQEEIQKVLKDPSKNIQTTGSCSKDDRDPDKDYQSHKMASPTDPDFNRTVGMLSHGLEPFDLFECESQDHKDFLPHPVLETVEVLNTNDSTGPSYQSYVDAQKPDNDSSAQTSGILNKSCRRG